MAAPPTPHPDCQSVLPIQTSSLPLPAAPDLGMGWAHAGPGPSSLCSCSSDVTQGTESPQRLRTAEADLQRGGQSSGKRKEKPPTLHKMAWYPRRYGSGTSHILEHSSSPSYPCPTVESPRTKKPNLPVCTSVQPWTGSSSSQSLHKAPRAGGPTLPVPPPLGPA